MNYEIINKFFFFLFKAFPSINDSRLFELRNNKKKKKKEREKGERTKDARCGEQKSSASVLVNMNV